MEEREGGEKENERASESERERERGRERGEVWCHLVPFRVHLLQPTVTVQSKHQQTRAHTHPETHIVSLQIFASNAAVFICPQIT